MSLWHKLVLLVLVLACLLEQVMSAPKKSQKPAPKKASKSKAPSKGKGKKSRDDDEDE